MVIRLLFFGVLLLSIGCLGPEDPKQIAKKFIHAWATSDASLPLNEAPFFEENFEYVSGELSSALTDKNESTRIRAAYILEQLGPVAAPLKDDLMLAIDSENSRLVRIYLYDAIQSLGEIDEVELDKLLMKFDALKINVENSSSEYNTIEDERIFLASALYVLDSNVQRKEAYLDEVSQWLEKPVSGMSETGLDVYWNHRWSSVIALEKMKGAEIVVLKLEAMLEEDGKKPWVSIHVPRVIHSLQTYRNAED